MANEPLLRELRQMKQRMDRLYSVAFPESETQPEDESAGEWTPAFDAFESADAWVVLIDVPGVDIEQLDMQIIGDTLKIRGRRDRTFPRDSAALRPLRVTRPAGRFSLTLTLPMHVAENKVTARYERGVLAISVSKDIDGVEVSSRIPVREG